MFEPTRFRRWLIGAAVLLAGLFPVLVLIDAVPLIRGPDAWRWWLLPFPAFSKILLAGSGVLLLLIIWWLLGRKLSDSPTRKRVLTSLIILAIVVFIVQLTFLSIYRSNPIAILYERLASDQASGYFTVAAEIDHLPTFLKAYPELMPTFRPDPHPRSKPPGIVLLYWGTMRLLERIPAVSEAVGHWARGIRCADLWLVGQSNAALASIAFVGVLTMAFSILVIWPAYGLAARRWGSQAGWLAAGLAAVMPGRLMFAPHLDTVYPLLALTAVYLLDTAVRRNRLWITFVAGGILSLATFFSLVNVLAAAVAGFFLLFHYLPERRWKLFARHTAGLVGGVLLIWVVYFAYARVSPFDIYLASRPARHDLERNYWLWLAGNVYDFAVFVGLPIFMTAVYWAIRQVRQLRPAPLTIAFWLMFMLVDISGVIRAEVGRIWLMLAPFPVVLAAQPFRKTSASLSVRRMSMILLVLSVLGLWAMSLRWEVTRLEWPAPTERIIETSLPDGPLIDKPFGPEIELASYEVAQSENELVVTLYWQSLERPDLPYTVFVHVLDEEGNIVGQQDTMPNDNLSPTTCWQPGEIITDSHRLELSSIAPGSYQVVAGLYHQASETRLGEIVLENDLIVGQ